jgi:hypothetical protein
MSTDQVKVVQTALEEKNRPLSEVTWNTEKVLAMACCIFRQKGFTSTSTVLISDPTSDQRWTNKEMLTYALCPQLASNNFLISFTPSEEDEEQAAIIIKYFRRLMFGVIADSNNDYMDRVFKSTQSDQIKLSDFGVLASVPSVYDKELIQKQIKEQIKDTVEGWIGKEGDTVILNIRYLSSRYVPKLNCYSHQAVTDDRYLINFLNKIELGKAGTNQKIRAKVKKHTVNYQTKTPETQLNYVKPLDTFLEWQ